jgi:hypothetical protein
MNNRGQEKAKLLLLIEEAEESLATMRNAQEIAERNLWIVNRRLETIKLIIEARNETEEEKGII